MNFLQLIISTLLLVSITESRPVIRVVEHNVTKEVTQANGTKTNVTSVTYNKQYLNITTNITATDPFFNGSLPKPPKNLTQMNTKINLNTTKIDAKKTNNKTSTEIAAPTKDDYNTLKTAGQDLLGKYWNALWQDGTFIDKTVCNSSQKGTKTSVWSLAVALQSFVDGQKFNDVNYKSNISSIYTALSGYWNPDFNMYGSFGSNTVPYVDDNAQIASALVEAYEVTKVSQYLSRAQTIVEAMMKQWNTKYGGVTWEVGQPYIATISTTEAALAAIRLNSHKKNSKYVKFAEDCMDWIREYMWDNSTNLLYDGTNNLTDTAKNIELTYHVGTALSLSVKLYQQTKDKKWKGYADLLAAAGINRNLKIYDRSYDEQFRYWYDSTAWTQLLAYGLVDYVNGINASAAVIQEVVREATYLHNFGQGTDNLYFGSLNPLTSDENIYKKWVAFTGTTKKSDIVNSKFCGGDPKNAPQRDLIAQAAASIMFLQTANGLQKYFK